MKMISIAMGAFVLTVWIAFGANQFYLAARSHKWRRVANLLAGLFITIGAIGFLGTVLAAMGAFNWLPASFEWPAGFATGVVSTGDNYVVPHTPSNRIQVYDANWKFLRGWHVDAGGGTFKLRVTETDHINVVTARKHMRYIYDLGGNLLSKESYSPNGNAYSSFPGDGVSHFVPTPIYLMVFSNPLLSWVAAAIGGGIVFSQRGSSKQSNLADPKAN